MACSSKGCPRPVAEGRKTCEYHLLYQRERRRQLRAQNPDYWRESEGRRIRKLRKEAFAMLGSRCQWCGENDPEVLTIDHIVNDGSGRAGGKVVRGVRMYRVYLAPGYPREKLQLLCANCHTRKTRRERGALPWDE